MKKKRFVVRVTFQVVEYWKVDAIDKETAEELYNIDGYMVDATEPEQIDIQIKEKDAP